MNRPLKTVLPLRPAHEAGKTVPALTGHTLRGRLQSFLAPRRSSYQGRGTK